MAHVYRILLSGMIALVAILCARLFKVMIFSHAGSTVTNDVITAGFVMVAFWVALEVISMTRRASDERSYEEIGKNG